MPRSHLGSEVRCSGPAFSTIGEKGNCIVIWSNPHWCRSGVHWCVCDAYMATSHRGRDCEIWQYRISILLYAINHHHSVCRLHSVHLSRLYTVLSSVSHTIFLNLHLPVYGLPYPSTYRLDFCFTSLDNTVSHVTLLFNPRSRRDGPL